MAARITPVMTGHGPDRAQFLEFAGHFIAQGKDFPGKADNGGIIRSSRKITSEHAVRLRHFFTHILKRGTFLKGCFFILHGYVLFTSIC
ncbi:hypothetical protein [Komagataeibacter melaceti]|uniref:hypothetical protein n=1 Tax=Komagataeibacter melaceti TaxID=2766577 RepID=UPI001F4E93C0|nr:hypothetical protein [Komagataeibacter melaceti]